MTDYLLFCLLAAFWGASFVAIKFVVLVFPPIFGAVLRVGLAFLILAGFFWLSGNKLRVPFRIRRRMWLAGLFAQGIPFCLLFWGERKISPGLAGMLNGTVPLWAFLLGLFATKSEHFSIKKFIGLSLGFAGIALICVPVIAFRGTRDEIAGTCAVLLMAVSYAIGALFNKHLMSGSDKVDFRANLFHQHYASLVFLAVVSLALERWPGIEALTSNGVAILAAAYLGIFSTAIAWLIFYHLIREWGAVRASTVTYVAPVMALFWDYVFFRNAPGPFEVIGVATILSGVILLKPPVSAKP